MSLKVALKIIQEAQRNNVSELNLSFLELTEIPSEISDLTQLTTLDLRYNQLTEIKGLEGFTQLTELNLSGNQLTEIKGLEGLTQLTEFDLSNNQLTEIKGLEGLTQLNRLYLSNNRLTEIKGLERLTRLSRLYLSSNRLTEIKGLEGLTQLTELDLSSNQLTGLKGLERLIQLTELSLSYNQLTGLKGLEGLTQLTKLDLRSNRLTEIKGLEGLTQLTELDLSSNQLTGLKGLEGLTQLTKLDLSSNQLTEIKGLEGITQLGVLYLSSNQLTEIKGLEGLTQLIVLDLSDNQLTTLPEAIGKLANLENLTLKDNQFKIGAEIYDLSPKEQIQEILKWQKAQQAGTLQPIHEAKVIFIGESNYGKTHLIELLRDGEIKRKITTTHGIERSQINVSCKGRNIRLNIWDLGGQEFMRSTHQFFFSERTLYVLVTLARRERNELNHWLKLADQLGNKAPVLVVINKVDSDPHDLDRKSLERDYPNIVGFVRTSIRDCEEGKAPDLLKLLKEKIIQIASDKHLMRGFLNSVRLIGLR